MSINSLKYVKANSEALEVLLHGSSGGMSYSLMQKIYGGCVKQGHSVANFNSPYFERGEEQSSGPELKEEIETLQTVLDKCVAKDYKHIRLVGKSLGAIITSFYPKSISKEEE